MHVYSPCWANDWTDVFPLKLNLFIICCVVPVCLLHVAGIFHEVCPNHLYFLLLTHPVIFLLFFPPPVHISCPLLLIYLIIIIEPEHFCSPRLLCSLGEKGSCHSWCPPADFRSKHLIWIIIAVETMELTSGAFIRNTCLKTNAWTSCDNKSYDNNEAVKFNTKRVVFMDLEFELLNRI